MYNKATSFDEINRYNISFKKYKIKKIKSVRALRTMPS